MKCDKNHTFWLLCYYQVTAIQNRCSWNFCLICLMASHYSEVLSAMKCMPLSVSCFGLHKCHDKFSLAWDFVNEKKQNKTTTTKQKKQQNNKTKQKNNNEKKQKQNKVNQISPLERPAWLKWNKGPVWFGPYLAPLRNSSNTCFSSLLLTHCLKMKIGDVPACYLEVIAISFSIHFSRSSRQFVGVGLYLAKSFHTK